MSHSAISMRRVGALVQPARRLHRLLIELRRDLLHRQRILADQLLADGVDDGAERLAAAALVELGPADETFIGGDLQEREVTEAGRGVQVFDLGDFHRMSMSEQLSGCRRRTGTAAFASGDDLGLIEPPVAEAGIRP